MNKEEFVAKYVSGHKDFSDEDLSDLDLSNLRFDDCNFSWASFSESKLTDTKFVNCNLTYTTFRSSNLLYSRFVYCISLDTKFTNADLTSSSFEDCNLCGANFRDAELLNTRFDSSNNLKDALFIGAKNLNAVIAASLFVPPQTGRFKAYKKLRNGAIALLEIPASAKRSSATSRKCRASKARVLKIWNLNNELINTGRSIHDSEFIYETGKLLEVKDFDEDRWNECSTGIHFFMTLEEAKDWH